VLGGIGQYQRSNAWRIVLGLMESMGAAYVSTEYKDAFAFVILIVFFDKTFSGISTDLRTRSEARETLSVSKKAHIKNYLRSSLGCDYASAFKGLNPHSSFLQAFGARLNGHFSYR